MESAGNRLVDHHFRPRENYGVGMIIGHLRGDELRKKFRIGMFLVQLAHLDRPQLQLVQTAAQGREVDPIGLVLPVHNALLLHVEGDDRKLADARLTRNIAQNRHQRRGIQGCSDDARNRCGAKLISTFTLIPFTNSREMGGSSRNGSGSVASTWLGPWPAGSLSLRAQHCGTRPVAAANAFTAVPHQPIHLILAFARNERAVELSVAARFLIQLGHAHFLNEIEGSSGRPRA